MIRLNEHVSKVHPGVMIKEEMQQLNLTPKELAFRTKISVHNLYCIFNGYKKVTKNIARKLCVALGKKPSYWLGLQYEYDWFLFKSIEG